MAALKVQQTNAEKASSARFKTSKQNFYTKNGGQLEPPFLFVRSYGSMPALYKLIAKRLAEFI